MILPRLFHHPVSKFRAQRRPLRADVTSGGEEIDGPELAAILREAFGAEDVYLARADRHYTTVDEATLRAWFRTDGTRRYRWKAEGGDCDDFADIAIGRVREAQMLGSRGRAVALGRIWALDFSLEAPGEPVKLTGPHAMVFAVLKDRSVVLVEPQDGSVYPLTRRSSVYFAGV